MLGPPGAGKGTQATRLAELALVPHVSSGDIFRDNVVRGTELGALAKTYMDKGSLVPDEVTISMVMDRVSREDTMRGYILDGFPRTKTQAISLDSELTKVGSGIDLAVLVDCPQEELFRRLSSRASEEGRVDDNPEVIKQRLQVYELQTLPLIDYYESQGKLKRLNGERDIDSVTQDLCALVGV
tara:strand:+ start:135 stop:686 length:552 start_codon:yes stop_codon:yes gene_type:complete